MADCTGRPRRPASGSTEVGGVVATPNIMCRWVDRLAAEEVRTVPNGKCFLQNISGQRRLSKPLVKEMAPRAEKPSDE